MLLKATDLYKVNTKTSLLILNGILFKHWHYVNRIFKVVYLFIVIPSLLCLNIKAWVWGTGSIYVGKLIKIFKNNILNFIW